MLNKPLFKRLHLIETVSVLCGPLSSLPHRAVPQKELGGSANCLSVTDSYHAWSDDHMNIVVPITEYKTTRVDNLSLVLGLESNQMDRWC
jgi:hypothetical protein